MRLSELIAEIPTLRVDRIGAVGDPDIDLEITGVTHDSRTVEPGDLYVALVGQRFDGRDFARDAVARGAVAVVVDEKRALLAPLAAAVYGHPDRELILAGVTGTNGKSTVATLLAAILGAAGIPAGFVGTLGYRFGAQTFPGGHTTPEASDLYRTLRRMRDAGARAVAMEVSSHALDPAMGRVAGVRFDVGVFTNLTRDHLDYHPDMESYFAAKRRLFDQLKPDQLKPGARAVVNLDDAWGRRLAAELTGALTFGVGGDVEAVESKLDAAGTHATLRTPRGTLRFSSPLLGTYNLANLLAAAAAAEALGLPHDAVVRAFAAQRPIPGRMEPVDHGQPFPVFVDYAHTDAALDAALRSAREVAGPAGKVAVVFGCGGDRDRGKRPLMGRVAGELADLPIATSDNPRSEDPLAILAAVEEGLKASGNASYRLVPDRREAIRQALGAAEPGWVVLVAGKGHEREQIIGDRKLPFSEFDEIEKALEERFGSPVRR
ncbi:MAG TPA: UDP-N-acetylmuramoyl-L-alanyl-D-glutamate--2,6-diaminopimelate ligase [Thermoanaerobaculia bacterium]|jgi:UDP-N-acetylmuramoyl-L-alanyl-D-glutamate--2,6-diaminopimelate ligase|nr:UDP-N-acetylmuramoyl-L-alanyl-D-glutamate--2,6-diaminopimelate ligase [Thermoanaerobaculia bacterium]